jgi:hypothetical protein
VDNGPRYSADHYDNNESDDNGDDIRHPYVDRINNNRDIYGYGVAFILGGIAGTLPGIVSGIGGWLVLAYLARRFAVRSLCRYIAARPDQLSHWRGDVLRLLSRRASREIVRVIGRESVKRSATTRPGAAVPVDVVESAGHGLPTVAGHDR